MPGNLELGGQAARPAGARQLRQLPTTRRTRVALAAGHPAPGVCVQGDEGWAKRGGLVFGGEGMDEGPGRDPGQ